MQRRVSNNIARFHFPSLRALATYNAEAPRVWKAHDSRDADADYSWDLGTGYDGALDLARNGWTDGAQRAHKALKAFAPKTAKPQTRYDIAGYRPSVGRYVAGLPDCMVRRDTRADAGSKRVLTLAVSVVAGAFTSAASMANYGVAVAQYVNQMERAGTRVHLIGTFAVERNGWRLALSWTVKRADQPLDLAALAFAIGHPAMLRRIGLAFMERQADAPEMSAYGSPQDAALKDLIDPPQGTVILNGMRAADREAATPALALAYVEAQIREAQKAA